MCLLENTLGTPEDNSKGTRMPRAPRTGRFPPSPPAGRSIVETLWFGQDGHGTGQDWESWLQGGTGSEVRMGNYLGNACPNPNDQGQRWPSGGRGRWDFYNSSFSNC